MAPIPEDNRQKLPNESDSEIDMFSNPNLSVTHEMSDSSDENEDDTSNIVDTAGYTLLSQEPGEAVDTDDDNDDDNDDNNYVNDERIRSGHGDSERNQGSSVNGESHCSVNQITSRLAEAIIHTEAGASAPVVSVSSSSCHPAFLAKFPDGNVPSYMQVPSMLSDSKDLLWNQKRQDKNVISMDSGQASKILKAMSGFSLPLDHVPEWARNLSDDQWKQHVLQKLSPEEKPVTATVPEETNSKSLNNLNSEQDGQLNTRESGPEWVASFPDP